MIGISGIRGIIGESFTPELITRLGAAYGVFVGGGGVVVGRDTRVSGEMVKHALFGGLIATGCRVIDVGMCTTPSLTIMIDELGADGGVMVSASHNPIQWNALKLYQSSGVILDQLEGREFLNIFYFGNFEYSSWEGIQDIELDHSTNRRHLKRIFDNADTDSIRKRAPRVVIDSCNGAGSLITPDMLRELGCEVIPLHCTPDGLFPHNPEPVFKNLGDLADTVRKEKADIGFAQDADADRIALVDERGNIIGEEMSLALAVDHVLAMRKGPVVTNMSTSRIIDDICTDHGCELHRTPVGEVNVAKKMIETGAVIGGEGNGGVIDPRISKGRDSLAGIALILEKYASEERSLSEIVGSYPSYSIVKEVMECPRDRISAVFAGLEDVYLNDRIDRSDGIKVIRDDSWAHIRCSATEPVVRIITEAPDRERAAVLNTEVREHMSRLAGSESEA
jgi:phosphomannomutase